MENFMLSKKNDFSMIFMWFINGLKNIINNKTPKILKIRFKLIILFVLFLVLTVDKYPVIVVPILAPNIINNDEVIEIRLLKYISSTTPIKPDDDWMTAVVNIPNKTDKEFIDWILFIMLYIYLLLIIELNPSLKISKPRSIKPTYIIRIKNFLWLLKIKNNKIRLQ